MTNFNHPSCCKGAFLITPIKVVVNRAIVILNFDMRKNVHFSFCTISVLNLLSISYSLVGSKHNLFVNIDFAAFPYCYDEDWAFVITANAVDIL